MVTSWLHRCVAVLLLWYPSACCMWNLLLAAPTPDENTSTALRTRVVTGLCPMKAGLGPLRGRAGHPGSAHCAVGSTTSPVSQGSLSPGALRKQLCLGHSQGPGRHTGSRVSSL